MSTVFNTPSSTHHYGFSNFLIEMVYLLVFLLTSILWAVIGFLVWIPLLLRTTTFFAATVLYSSLFRDQERLAQAERAVRFAVHFYLQGFRHFASFHKNRHEVDQPLKPLSELKWKELLAESLWVAAFWGLSFFLERTYLGWF